MSISQDARSWFQLFPAFHFTLIQNLPEILRAGHLLSKALVGHRAQGDLSDASIQRARSERVIPQTGRTVHEYVPLYFGFKTPMLSQRRDRNEDIIYLRFSLEVLGIPGAVFSDGNASAHATKFYLFKEARDLAVLDHATINGVKWGNDEDKKRRKQAEILIPDQLNFLHMLDLFCFSESARVRAQLVLEQADMKRSVFVKPGFYYTEVAP